MSQITTIITDYQHERIGVIVEVVHSYPSPDELLRAIRKFLLEWAETEDGREAARASCDSFNWGDFADWSAILQGKIPGISNITYIYPDIEKKRTAVILDHEELLFNGEGL